jgi:thioredoxin 1
MKYLKYVVLAGALLILGTVNIYGAAKKIDQQKQQSKIKVTFIELGSVNCIPCKAMQPIMEDIKKEYIGQVEVVFYDVWTAAGRPFGEKYQIRVIPTQVFLDKDGKEYFRHVGFFPKEELVKVLKQQGVK